MSEASSALPPEENAFDVWDEPDAKGKTYTTKELDELLAKGVELHKKGLTKEAMELYKEILVHDRGNHKALYFTAIALSQENQPEEKVLEIMKHAVSKAENVPEAHYNLGILLHRMGKEDEARERFERAIKLMPKLTEAKVSLAGCFLNQGDRAMGTYWLREATRSICEAPDSVYSRAFAKLTLGDLMGGWIDYDRRWKTASFLVENRREFGNATHWNGKPIPGKNLYIHTEQGAGDVIMFSRFIEKVAALSQAKTIVLEVGESLTKFMAQVKGVDFVIPSNMPTPAEALPVHHFLPLMGMMRKCNFFDYAKVPYAEGWLEPLESAFQVPPEPAKQFRVGIAWAGSKFHKNDRYRSIAWPQFREAIITPFIERSDTRFYSFQVGERARDIDDAPGLEHLIVDLTPQLKDFNDTAAAASKMDLMVLVDTATVHVAASLKHGPPVLMLVPAAPDWRWLLKGWDTPWYDRVTLFRQDKAEEWGPALEMAQKNVESFVDEISATR